MGRNKHTRLEALRLQEEMGDLTPADRIYLNNKGLPWRRRRDRTMWRTTECQMPNCNERTLKDFQGDSIGVCWDHGIYVADWFARYREEHPLDDLAAKRAEAQAKHDRREKQKAESRAMSPGWIYYLLVGDRIKIGYSVDVRARLRSYPPDSPLLAVHPGTKNLEAEMHSKFAGSKAAGREWFLDTDEIRQHIHDVILQFGEPDRVRLEHRSNSAGMSAKKARR